MRSSTCRAGGVGYTLFALGVFLFLFLPNKAVGALLAFIASIPIVIANFMAARDLSSPKIRKLTIAALITIAISLFFAMFKGGMNLPDAISSNVQADEAAVEEQGSEKANPDSTEGADTTAGKSAETIGSERAATEDQTQNPKSKGSIAGRSKRSVIISAIIAWIFGMAAASMWFEVYKVVAAQTDIKQFRSGGLLIFLGSILLIAIAGIILCEAGYIMLAVAFFKAKA